MRPLVRWGAPSAMLTDFNSYVTVSIADGAPKRTNGRMAASDRPGLGISPKLEALGKPVALYA